MEEGFYICSWSSSEAGYELWLKVKPSVRGSGSTYEAAEQALLNAIMDSGGAMHSVLEFVPPLPPADNIRRYLVPAIVRIWGDERFELAGPRRPGAFATPAERETYTDGLDSFYEGGLCRECRSPRGPRTPIPLELKYVGSGCAGGFVSIGGGTSYVFAQKFLDLLTHSERASLELRKVIPPTRCRITFYELLGPSGPTFVGLKGVAPHASWECDACGYRLFSYLRTDFDLGDFVAQEDLPTPLPGIFTIGHSPHVALAVTADRWAELVGQKQARGILSVPLGIAPSDQSDRTPPLRKRSDPDPAIEARRAAYWSKHSRRLPPLQR
jgi:hypothetical protein